MEDFIAILAQILLNVARGSVDMEPDGEFSANDIIFANKLLRQTVQRQTFLNNPNAKTLATIIKALCAQDPELCAWAEKEVSERGESALTKHLWITYATMR